MISTESAVQFKVVRIIKERASEGKQQFLEREGKLHQTWFIRCLLALAWHLTTLLSPRSSSFRHQGPSASGRHRLKPGSTICQLMECTAQACLQQIFSPTEKFWQQSFVTQCAVKNKKVLSKKIHPARQDINNLRGSLIKPALPYLGRMMLAVYFLSPFLLPSAFPSREGPHEKKKKKIKSLQSCPTL